MPISTPYCYAHPRPALTVDLVLFCIQNAQEYVLLIQRKHPPFVHQWALPGGFVNEGETLEHAALRELEEETHLTGISIYQIGAFGAPGRDPRGWTVSVAFTSLVDDCVFPEAGDDAADASWHPLNNLPTLAFDHHQIIKAALKSLR